MSPLLHTALMFVHLAAAGVWLGGMVFVHIALRPVAAQVLEPPQRMTLMAATLGRFFRLVVASIVALFASGALMLVPHGLRGAPLGWHAMLTLAIAMTVISLWIYGRLFPKLRLEVTERSWPEAGGTLARIRQWGFVNLCLGVGTVMAAMSPRL